MSNDISQGNIYMCDLTINSIENEQSGLHPVLVVSANIRNQYSKNVFIFPITHANKKFQPTHYKLYKETYPFFLYNKNTVQCEEGRSISKKRIGRYIGRINEDDLLEILKRKEFIFVEV